MGIPTPSLYLAFTSSIEVSHTERERERERERETDRQRHIEVYHSTDHQDHVGKRTWKLLSFTNGGLSKFLE